MLPVSALPHQFRILPEKPGERGRVARNNGIGGRFEPGGWRRGLSQAFEMSDELRPTGKAVLASHKRLRCREFAFGAGSIGFEVFLPAFGPAADGIKIARFTGLLQVFRDFPVLFQAGSSRERTHIGHIPIHRTWAGPFRGPDAPLALVLKLKLLQIGFQGVDQLFCSLRLFVGRITLLVEDMKTNVAFEDFSHQGIQSATTHGDGVQGLGAFRFFFERTDNDVHLAADTASPVQ